MFCGVDKFARHDVGKIADLESSYPQVVLRIIHLIQIHHGAFISAGTTGPRELIPVQHNLVLHHSLALYAEIIEGKAFDCALHRCPSRWSGQIQGGGLLMQHEDFVAVGFEGALLACESLTFFFKP